MKLRALLACLLLPVGLPAGFAQEATPSTETAAVTPATELQALTNRIRAKLRAGQRSASDLKDDLAAFDALVAKYHDQKTDEVAQILFMKATLLGQVLKDPEGAKQVVARLMAEFPETKPAKAANSMLNAIVKPDEELKERRRKAEETRAALVGKPAPELHFKWANREGLKTLSDLKGKVVVLDFWATWCGPCVASFPNVRELTAHYKDMDVAIVGVTSIQGSVSGLGDKIDTRGNPEKEMALMTDYIKAKDITWIIAFSEEEVFNKDYAIMGIPHMVIIAPDGTVRHADMDPRDPHEVKVSRIDALLKEFGKPVLASSPNQ